MATAGVGMVVNSITALMFARGREHDLNVRGVFLHMAGDAGISLGVIVAAATILTHWTWLDPVVSLAIVAIIVWGTWGLFARPRTLRSTPRRPAPTSTRSTTFWPGARASRRCTTCTSGR